ncbi:MAG: hypothetical protein PHN32_00860 [Actinomycetota bacterium]|nr:hypothetical protein [Actinomycetota bacterium]
MNNLKKYIKIAKDVTIQPQDNTVQEKILERISQVSPKDRELLDEDFMEYLRRNNSRLYLFAEGVRNNPVKFLLLLSASLLVISLIIYEIKKIYLSPSKDKPQQ